MKTRARVWLTRALQVAFGLALGAGFVEAGFDARDGGAFPHVNVYRADAQLGVRLRPGAQQRFALHDNPPSEIRINAAGLRGAELRAPGANEILVVGDSQAFGLGVDDDQTFSARLAKLTGRPVVNAGVPTYGPLEYNALAGELLRARKPTTVIYTVNMLNDLFEHARPNRERHRVWDGWAVRAETAPASVLAFPGRDWLFGRSHAVYALRRYLHDREAPAGAGSDPGSFASEGSARDLLGEATQRGTKVAAEEAAQRKREAELAKASGVLQSASESLQAAQLKLARENNSWGARRTLRIYAPIAEARPGDIVRELGSEEARPIEVTAEHIREAVKLRDQAITELTRVREMERARLLLASQLRSNARAQVRGLRAEIAADRRPPSALLERLRELRALCDQYGAEAVVVALPIDVQVSSAEWRKYGQRPVDMSATLALTEDVLADARALGMRTLDALPALRAAEPGAFLNGDIHMTAKGHVALASALAGALKLPAPSPEPDPGLPAGRTFPPSSESELQEADQLDVEGQESAGCELWALDEWLVIMCGARDEIAPRVLEVELLEGGRGETLIIQDGLNARVRAPLFGGDVLRVRFIFEDHTQVVRAERSGTGELTAAFEPRVRTPRIPRDTLGNVRREPAPGPQSGLCNCGGISYCDTRYSPDRPDCARSFPSDCDQQYLCIEGNPDAWPTCAPGSVRGDPSGRCLPLCGKNRACAVGRCERWQGLDVCRPRS